MWPKTPPLLSPSNDPFRYEPIRLHPSMMQREKGVQRGTEKKDSDQFWLRNLATIRPSQHILGESGYVWACSNWPIYSF